MSTVDGGFRYSPEMIEYILSMRGLPGEEVVARFNARFKLNKNRTELSRAAKKRDPSFRFHKHYYTKEQDDWLRKNRPYICSTEELVKRFNEEFGTTCSMTAIYVRCSRLGISSINDGRFKKGECNSPFVKPIGTEVVRESETNKGIYIKVSDDPKSRYTNWIPKQNYIWEREYGPIPEGYTVTFLDGNPRNCNIENLICVPQKHRAAANLRGWSSKDPEWNKLIFKWMELDDLLAASTSPIVDKEVHEDVREEETL